MYICEICRKEFELITSLARHNSRVHKIGPEETYVKYVLNNVLPECKCGCGGKPGFLTVEKGFVDYIQGHASRVNNNWGHNKEAVRKSHETQKKMYNSGELKIWNKGLTIEDDRVKSYSQKVTKNPDRNAKISKARKGLKHSEKSKKLMSDNLKIIWSDQERRNKQRENRVKYHKEKPFLKKSKLEIYFTELLNKLGIIYEPQFPISGYLFDFYVESKNTLIEVDGDWYHCNPNLKIQPQYPIQEHTVENDIIKTNLAKEKGYKLIRFWEDDIKNSLDVVIEKLRALV